MAEMGRPKKYSTERVKAVIDDYVSFTGGTVLLIASKIARYAVKEIELTDFKYYDITRDSEANKYMEDLNEEISKGEGKKLTSAVTAFTQIDVKVYQAMPERQLGQALTNLNTFMEDMADSNTKIFKANLSLKDTVRQKDIEIKKLNDKVDEIVKASADSMAKLQKTIHEQREIINTLTQSIKLKDDTLHLLWDKEAEVILKQTGVFENDGVEINPKRMVTDIEESIIPIATDATKIDSAKETGKISSKFMDRLKKI